jgi:hypothetical protein
VRERRVMRQTRSQPASASSSDPPHFAEHRELRLRAAFDPCKHATKQLRSPPQILRATGQPLSPGLKTQPCRQLGKIRTQRRGLLSRQPPDHIVVVAMLTGEARRQLRLTDSTMLWIACTCVIATAPPPDNPCASNSS